MLLLSKPGCQTASVSRFAVERDPVFTETQTHSDQSDVSSVSTQPHCCRIGLAGLHHKGRQ